MNKIVKRITAMATAVMMVASISAVSAGAFHATACPQLKNGKKVGYLYCNQIGSHTYNSVSGISESAGSTIFSLTRPDYLVQGNISATLSIAYGSGTEQHTYGNSVSCSLTTKISVDKTTVSSTHSISNTGSYGSLSYSLQETNV